MWHSLLLLLALSAPNSRDQIDLSGVWEVTTGDPTDPATEWLPIAVPGPWEPTLGDDFDGTATYRSWLYIPEDFEGERLLLHFEAVATHARVWLNAELAAEHLGGWTPFRADVTTLARRGEENLLWVTVEERVGHNTQGFLPIIAPHFGGIWQPVTLLGLPGAYLDDLRILALGDAERGVLTLEAPSRGAPPDAYVVAETFIDGKRHQKTFRGGRAELEVEGFTPWTPGDPALYDVTFRLLRRGAVEVDRYVVRTGFRSVTTDGRVLRFNGAPLNVRGVLEWGYYPPLFAPDPDPAVVVAMIHEAKARGFNLIKFCLWLPPWWILDLMDETGMLAWVEYPTWHPRIDEEHRADLTAEYEEFFAHDRNHPSVVVRSLTCETGHSAELDVIAELYHRAKAAIPGALVEDDSSWIGWHRIHDFYDDHPYGNNDRWPATIARLNAHIDEREAKPLLLGEAIAADTWLDRTLADLDPESPFAPWCLDAQAAWEAKVADRFGRTAIDRLMPISLRFAMNQRKDQIEQFRLLAPDAGYVVSVARDFPKARMGLWDAEMRPKWRVDEWAWHGDTMILLGADSKRSVLAGQATAIDVHVAHHGAETLPAGVLRYAFAGHVGEVTHEAIEPGAVVSVGTLELPVPDVASPRELSLSAQLDGGAAVNRWSLWAFPVTEPSGGTDGVVVAEALTPELVQRIRAGASAIITPGRGPGSFLLREHWLLRGSLWFPDHPILHDASAELFTDLVVKDLHPVGLLPLDDLFDHVDPIVGFWDNHDLREMKDWGMLVETRVGAGRLIVSALRHEDTPAGEWLLDRLRRHAAAGPAPRAALPDAIVDDIAGRLVARELDLTGRVWQFRPDDGGSDGWQEIRVGRSWEAQGHPTLDGWATYRLSVDVPADWAGEPVYLHFAGVDDAYEVYVDGVQRGTGGDIGEQRTAFDEEKSHRLMDAATPGQVTIDVRVYDWYGAGGIHRPVRLATRPLGSASRYLRGPADG